MSTSDELEFIYRKSLSQPFSELLIDPLTELTRKRQTTLLIISTVTLLLSTNLIALSGVVVDVTATKLTLSTPQVAKWLAFSVTFYLLVIYLFSVRADWVVAKAKQWSPLASIAEIKSAMASDHEARIQAGHQRKKEMERLDHRHDEISAEYKLRSDKISQRSSEVSLLIAALPEYGVASHKEREVLSSLFHEASELARAEYANWNEMRELLKPLEESKSQMIRDMSLERSFAMVEERNDVESMFSVFTRLTSLRIFVEIIFPVAYAVFSLTGVVYYS